jgi:L-alanine-DL-glutamate epimerase-like enolase superfamily enzyme
MQALSNQMTGSMLQSYRITRFQFRRDRVIGDSQVAIADQHCLALELTDGQGRTGLGFQGALFDAFPAQAQCEAAFAAQAWPGLQGQSPQALVHRIDRPRGGNRRDRAGGFSEPIQMALWDLASQQAELPLAVYLGARRMAVPAYASGLDFHMDDAAFARFFDRARAAGFTAFKIKVGHPDPARDLHRISLLRQVVGSDALVMIDANEAWTAKEAAVRLQSIRDAGHPIFWVEDPILRDDFAGLKMLREQVPWTQINSGEYLDMTGRRALLQAGGADIINLHGRIAETMHLGWLAADMGVPVSIGNTFLEVGVHLACALPEVQWMEFSFQNYDHLVDQPILIRDGMAHVPERPGHGLTLSDAARRDWAVPDPLPPEKLRTGPDCAVLQRLDAKTDKSEGRVGT